LGVNFGIFWVFLGAILGPVLELVLVHILALFGAHYGFLGGNGLFLVGF